MAQQILENLKPEEGHIEKWMMPQTSSKRPGKKCFGIEIEFSGLIEAKGSSKGYSIKS